MTLFAPAFARLKASDAAPALDISRLDRSCWRVTDPAVEYSDRAHLLGYIERIRRDRFEVLWLLEPIGWAYVDSFDTAVEALAHRARFVGTRQEQRDPTAPAASEPVIHRILRRSSFDPSLKA